MNKKKVILSLGGNQEYTLNSFKFALKEIEKSVGNILKSSSLYSSGAWGFNEETPAFLNQVIEIETLLSPQEVLINTQKIENKLGRLPKTKKEYESRIVDIDILFYEQFITTSKTLTIPHYLIHKRRFILVPLLEISPNFIHPVFQKTIKKLLLQCEDTLKVLKI
jgi:2-amino-4-hydroxy-6-hydroxymethyldihydropteridine diphosphokinase